MLAQGLATAAIYFVLDRMGGRPGAPPPARHPRAASPSPPLPLPVLTDAQAAQVTAPLAGGGRAFSPAIREGLLRELSYRSVTPQARFGLSAWVPGPLRGDLEVAAEVIRRAVGRGLTVVATGSIILTKIDASVPAVLVAIPEGDVQRVTAAGSPFAVLAQPAAPAEAMKSEEPSQSSAPEPSQPFDPDPAPENERKGRRRAATSQANGVSPPNGAARIPAEVG